LKTTYCTATKLSITPVYIKVKRLLIMLKKIIAKLKRKPEKTSENIDAYTEYKNKKSSQEEK
jgi:hypothetical protein